MYDNDKSYIFDCLHIFQIFLSLFMFSNVVEILETHLEGIFKSDRSNVLVTRPQPNNGIFCWGLLCKLPCFTLKCIYMHTIYVQYYYYARVARTDWGINPFDYKRILINMRCKDLWGGRRVKRNRREPCSRWLISPLSVIWYKIS